jgi:thiol-disulfide isomerase/thioredoxin
MRKIIVFSLVSICFAFAVYLSYKVTSGIKQKQFIKKNTATLPQFSFVMLNNKIYRNADIPNINSKIIINFFSPSCEHCQYMATQFLKNREQLKDIIILMVTTEDSNNVTKFNKDYLLNTLPNIVLLRDDSFRFYEIFGTAAIPSFFVYEKQILVKKIIGETKIENILN